MPHIRIRTALGITSLLLAALLVYAVCAIRGVLGSEPAQERVTASMLNDILFSVREYRRAHHEWPIDEKNGTLCFTHEPVFVEHSSSFFKKAMREGGLLDSWGNSFSAGVSTGRFLLVSAGPDGMISTADDITGWFPIDGQGTPLDGSAITVVCPAEKTGDR